MPKSCPFFQKVAKKLPGFEKVAQKLPTKRLAMEPAEASKSIWYVVWSYFWSGKIAEILNYYNSWLEFFCLHSVLDQLRSISGMPKNTIGFAIHQNFKFYSELVTLFSRRNNQNLKTAWNVWFNNMPSSIFVIRFQNINTPEVIERCNFLKSFVPLPCLRLQL